MFLTKETPFDLLIFSCTDIVYNPLFQLFKKSRFRDNLYANRKKMEVQGHMKYRRINNVDIDQTSGLVQVTQQT